MFAKSILLFFCRSAAGIYHAACGRFLAQLFIIPMISGQQAVSGLYSYLPLASHHNLYSSNTDLQNNFPTLIELSVKHNKTYTTYTEIYMAISLQIRETFAKVNIGPSIIQCRRQNGHLSQKHFVLSQQIQKPFKGHLFP